MAFPLLIHSNISQVLSPWTLRMLCTIEVSSDILTLIFLALLFISMWRAKVVHPTFRLISVSIALHYVAAMIARCIIIYYQLNDFPISRDDTLIFMCDIVRDHFLMFFVSELGGVSFERAVATIHWSWYERRGSGTLLIFLGAKAIAVVPSLINVLLCEFEYYTHLVNFCVCVLIVICSFLLRSLRNYDDHYSVSEAFQLKENLAVLRVIFFFICSCLPIVFFSVLLFGLYFFGPSSMNMTFSHSVILIDLSIAVYAPIFVIVAAHGMADYRRQLYMIRPVLYLARLAGAAAPNTGVREIQIESATQLYFSQLADTWS